MIALIDADLVAYRCAATVTEDMEEDIAYYRMDVLIQQIIEATSGSFYQCYLTGRNNFRKKINPEYKANRKDTVPPVYLQQCRQWLIDNHNAIVSDGCEADDLLGIYQDQNTMICSLDKDLQMIPGKHYNWTKVELSTVNKQDGLRHFYKQMLIGDKADNIFGVDKIGPVKAGKAIDYLDDEQDMFNVVYSLYNEDAERFVMNANCLWIQRNHGEVWASQQNLILPEPCALAVEASLEFMKSLNQTTLTEPTTTKEASFGTQSNGAGTDSIHTNQQPLI